MASATPTEAVCPACNNSGYVPESEDEVTGCTEPGCPYWAEHDAKQGSIVIDITPRPVKERRHYRHGVPGGISFEQFLAEEEAATHMTREQIVALQREFGLV